MKDRILFVDDEPNVLDGLRRMLRGMRGEWDMAFVEGGPAALEALEQAPFAVIVSDMRMPGMDGAELLSKVRKRHPGMVRIILSGFSSEESILRTVGPAHQYLTKPCEPELLIAMIRRTLELRRLLSSPPLRTLMGGMGTLPSPPDIYFRLVDYIESPRASAAQVAEIISKDVAMTAEVLRLTNSAYFSRPGSATTPLQAVRVLGFETLKSLILKIGIFRQFAGKQSLAPVIEAINRYGSGIALLARRAGEIEALPQHRIDQAFCAGMLCGVGILVMIDRMPEEFHAASGRSSTTRDRITAEHEFFGTTHAEVGAYLLGLWGFNDPVVEAVAYHLMPRACPSREIGVLTCLHVAHALGPGCPVLGEERQDCDELLDEVYLREIGMADRLPAIRMALAEGQ